MVHCSVDELAAFLGGHLIGAQVRRLEGHLDACAQCRRFINALVKASGDEAGRLEKAAKKDGR